MSPELLMLQLLCTSVQTHIIPLYSVAFIRIGQTLTFDLQTSIALINPDWLLESFSHRLHCCLCFSVGLQLDLIIWDDGEFPWQRLTDIWCLALLGDTFSAVIPCRTQGSSSVSELKWSSLKVSIGHCFHNVTQKNEMRQNNSRQMPW